MLWPGAVLSAFSAKGNTHPILYNAKIGVGEFIAIYTNNIPDDDEFSASIERVDKPLVVRYQMSRAPHVL